MNYSEAAAAVVNGEIIRRKDGNRDEFIFVKEKVVLSPDAILQLQMSDKAKTFLAELNRGVCFNSYFCLWKDGEVHGGWRPNASDLNAEWEVVDVAVKFPVKCIIEVTSRGN